jgi:hypothetical protein
MNNGFKGVALGLALTLAQPAGAQAPLDAQALSQCAGMALRLRSESPELQRQAVDNNRQRQALSRQHAAIDSGTDGDADRWLRYNAAAAAFNEHMARFRHAVVELNEVKQRYARGCAGRPYDNADLASLSPAEQQAMRAGLADISVPYLAPR